jgi:lipopolysaccharide biosynthesis protein
MSKNSIFFRRILTACQKIRFFKKSNDWQLIKRSGIFDAKFAMGGSFFGGQDSIEWYLKVSKGDAVRKPMPGFHPGIYLESNQTEGEEPFCHFLKNNRPRGPWLTEVIRPPKDVPKIENHAQGGRFALHIHLHYHEEATEILTRVLRIPSMDLKISVTSADGFEFVVACLRKLSITRADLRIVPNRGRNIGPLITEFGNDLKNYEIVGHVHSKRSVLVSNRQLVEKWKHFLLENMLGGLSPITESILSRFQMDPELGLVFPDDPAIIGWTKNLSHAESLALRMGIPLPLPKQINFPVGTMFWARPQALEPLLSLNLRWEDYPEEPIGYDGTMLHAIERLLPLIAHVAGYRYAVTNVPGVTR